eukprot:11106678-Alexandrium_andersonii.AAC.2
MGALRDLNVPLYPKDHSKQDGTPVGKAKAKAKAKGKAKMRGKGAQKSVAAKKRKRQRDEDADLLDKSEASGCEDTEALEGKQTRASALVGLKAWEVVGGRQIPRGGARAGTPSSPEAEDALAVFRAAVARNTPTMRLARRPRWASRRRAREHGTRTSGALKARAAHFLRRCNRWRQMPWLREVAALRLCETLSHKH